MYKYVQTSYQYISYYFCYQALTVNRIIHDRLIVVKVCTLISLTSAPVGKNIPKVSLDIPQVSLNALVSLFTVSSQWWKW